MDNDDTINLICVICNSTNFALNDGFYFCTECGTQSKTRRVVEVDIHSGLKLTRLKINKEKPREVETTTWECFNYLLHGLVEQLICLGAKDELKLTALQLWSAYLKKSEVAFFDNKRSQLPKLGPSFTERDAKILYNHELTKKRKRYSNKSEVSGNLSSRQLSRRKKKLAQSEYEENTTSSFYNSSKTRLSSSTDTTGKSVRLSLTSTARKIFKRSISKSHLCKHEEDSLKELDCHNLKIVKKNLPRKVWEEQLNRRSIYTILYLALNLIQDDIQLSDMLRYQREGHLATYQIQQFFPENIAESCTKIINREFISKRFVDLHISIRKRAKILCRFIGVKELRMPDLSKLANRYRQDLNLPVEISNYCERLINLCPPNMKLKFTTKQPLCCYEGRAIAYLIFILKLIFGLDGYKEMCISNSARLVNEKLKMLHITKTLFVWEDWVQFIEMRRLILAQRNLGASIQSKSSISQQHYIEQIIAENAHSKEDILKSKRTNFRNMNNIFNNLYERTKNVLCEPQLTEFHPTLTPHTVYFNIISSNSSDNIFIPQFMNKKFSETDLHSFLNPFKLKKKLQDYNVNLHVTKIGYPMKINYVKPFQHIDPTARNVFRDVSVRKVVFNIDENEWLRDIKNKHSFTSKEFLVPLKEKPEKETSNSNEEIELNNCNGSNSFQHQKMLNLTKNIEDVLEISDEKIKHENLFDNNNEEEIVIEFPRRNLENNYIFGNLSADDITDDEELKENLKFIISNSDYYTLFGKMNYITIKQFDEIKKALPSSLLWLLEFCSNYLQIDTKDLYEELLIIENQFLYALEDLNKMKDILISNTEFENPVIERHCEYYKNIW